jgi:hypothetical protein
VNRWADRPPWHEGWDTRPVDWYVPPSPYRVPPAPSRPDVAVKRDPAVDLDAYRQMAGILVSGFGGAVVGSLLPDSPLVTISLTYLLVGSLILLRSFDSVATTGSNRWSLRSIPWWITTSILMLLVGILVGATTTFGILL